jgi:hypothetical protein
MTLRALVRADVEHGEHVRVVEGADRARLLVESAEPLGVRAVRGGEDLDGDVATEALVVGAVDLAHGAGADESGDVVAVDAGSVRDGHGPGILPSARRVVEARGRAPARRA